ncbi:hypothetical protein Tco_0014957 [Tanacetum coccineum]
MSFVKRSDAAPVCYSKPLDSVKNWNDYFFWVDSTAFPLFVSLKIKILNKDPPPKLSQYDTQAFDFLQMDLFSFIRHSDPTKLLIGERNVADGEVKLLTMTEGRVVSLAPPASAASGGSNDSIDKLFDDGNDPEPEHPTVGDDDVLAKTVAKDVSEVVMEKTKKSKRKRKTTRDASVSIFPPKKLREDYHAATSNIGGKSLATIRSLILEGSSVPSEVAKPHDDGLADSVSGLNLRTRPPSMRYVVSSHDSYHSDSRFEVNSFARSPVADAPIMTVAITTTVVADVSIVPVSKDMVRSGNLENFKDYASAGGANANATSSSKLNEPATSSDSFYASQDLDFETLHNIYVPKWKVTNDSVLDDLTTNVSWGGKKDAEIAHLKSLLSLREAKAAEAIRLRGQLSAVEAADAAKNNELRDLKERNFALEGEKDVLKVTTLESVTALKETELASLTAQVVQLTSDLSGFQLSRDELSSKVASLESERDRLANQVFVGSAFELFQGRMEAMQYEQETVMGNRVAELDAQLLEMAAHLEEEIYPRFLTAISGRRWILTHGLKLVLLKCLQSSEYLQALGQAIGCAINKGIQDGLKAGVDHGKAGRDLSVIEAYDPSAEAKYVDAMSALRTVDFSLLSVLKSKKDASIVDLMDSLRFEGPLAEIPRAEELQPSPEQLMLPIHRAEDDSLIGEAGTSAAPATAEPINTLSTTFASFGVVPSLSVSDYQVSNPEPHDEDPPVTTFEEKELDTIPKSVVVS